MTLREMNAHRTEIVPDIGRLVRNRRYNDNPVCESKCASARKWSFASVLRLCGQDAGRHTTSRRQQLPRETARDWGRSGSGRPGDDSSLRSWIFTLSVDSTDGL